MSVANSIWKFAFGQDLPASLQPDPPETSFYDPVKGMSDQDVRRIVGDLVDNANLYYNTDTRFENVPTSVLRDSLYGAQQSNRPGLLLSRKTNVEPALTTRLREGAHYRPHVQFTPTGVDAYRMWHPNELVAPYAQTYNDEWGYYSE